jgi:hypothetical protein
LTNLQNIFEILTASLLLVAHVPFLSVFLEKLLATASDVEVEDVDKDGDADEEWHR